jgi:hypothetical protein
MPSSRFLLVAAVAALATAAGPAQAADAPPIKDGVHCTQAPKASYRLGAVVRHGMAIEITCDGPARFFAVPEFVAMTPQDRDLTIAGGHSIPAISRVKERSMSEAGTVTVRPTFTKLGIRIMRRYPKTKIKIGLGTEREDGHFWSEPGDWSRTLVKR